MGMGIIYYISARKVMIFVLSVGLSVTLTVFPSDYLKSSEQSCMTLSLEVLFRTKEQLIIFWR